MMTRMDESKDVSAEEVVRQTRQAYQEWAMRIGVAERHTPFGERGGSNIRYPMGHPIMGTEGRVGRDWGPICVRVGVSRRFDRLEHRLVGVYDASVLKDVLATFERAGVRHRTRSIIGENARAVYARHSVEDEKGTGVGE